MRFNDDGKNTQSSGQGVLCSVAKDPFADDVLARNPAKRRTPFSDGDWQT